MDFERFKQINDERINYREMEDANLVSSYRNTGCGDGYRIYLKIDESDPQKAVLDASYTTTGCGFGLVSLAMATEWAKGKKLQELLKISAKDIEEAFCFPPRRKNYPASAAECIRKAASDYLHGTGIALEKRVTRKRVLDKLKKEGDLRNANLRQVCLDGEDLEGVDFSGADLSHAFMTGCNLQRANFSKSRLRGSFFNNADLRGAKLCEADLRWAKFTGADLGGVLMQNALYDIGTRLDPRHSHLFSQMQKSDGAREIYLKRTP